MAFWSVVLAVALLTTRAWSTQDDLGTNDTDGDPRGGLSFILPAPYKDPNTHPGTRTRNPFLRRKSLEVEAPPLSTVTREPDIVVRYVDGHEEVFEEALQEHGLDGERVRRQVEPSREAGSGRAPGLSGAGPPRVFDLGETANGGGKAVYGGAEGKSGSYRSDDVKERGIEGEEQETPLVDTSESFSQASVDHGENESRALGVTDASNENRSVQNEQITRTTDGAEGLRTEAETTTVKRERQREHPPSGRVLPDVHEMSSSLGFSIRQYYQDLLNYYSLYQAPTNHLPLDLESAVYEAPGPESGIYARTTYQQNLPHYYVVYPYGSNWSPAGGSSLMQDFRYESPSASEAAGSGVYRLTLDRLREALRAPSDQPDDEESPNGSAKPPTNPDDPPASPDEPPVKPENLPMNPSEAPTKRQEPPSASKESRSPSRIPSQLRTLFSRVGRGSSHACQAGKCEADRNAKTAVLGSEIGGNPLAGTPGGVLRYTQPFMDTFPLSRRGLSWPFGYDLARGPVYYPSTHLISPHWQNSPSADVSNPSSPSDNPFSYSSSPSLHSNNPTSHTDNLFSHISNRPSHANKPFSGTDNPSSDTNPSSHANNLSSDTNSPSSHANHNFQHLSNPHFSEPSSRSAPQDFDDDARGSPVDSRSKEELEPRDPESTSGRRPHGSYTPSNEHTGTVQDSLIGNGAGDTTHLTYDFLSPSNHGQQAYRFLTESHVTVLPPHVEAATDNHFPYDLQLGYNMYAIKSGGGPPTNARVLASQFEPQSSVKPNTRDSENNREYRANERAQIVLADPIGYETQVLTGDQARYDTQGEKDQKESGAQGKYQLGEITGSNQPVYGYRWVSDERADFDDEQEYYVSVAEQDAREQAEPDPVMVQEDRRQRNYETLYPFLILHHGQEL